MNFSGLSDIVDLFGRSGDRKNALSRWDLDFDLKWMLKNGDRDDQVIATAARFDVALSAVFSGLSVFCSESVYNNL